MEVLKGIHEPLLEICCENCKTVMRVDDSDWKFEKFCKYPYRWYEDKNKGFFNRFLICPTCGNKIFDNRRQSDGFSMRLRSLNFS